MKKIVNAILLKQIIYDLSLYVAIGLILGIKLFLKEEYM